MIPLKLQIKNFLSYGPQTQNIDFEPYHLICLSGRNGHGKSALLDAITWAIWGQARKIAGTIKADAQLVHLGQTNMMVVFDFAFNSQTYRIRREYTKTYGKPLAVLDFGIVDPHTQAFSPLTTTTITATQETIEHTIGLSYEAFINSAFLRQGNSNEFSKKSARDRKDILGTILGLQHYDAIRKAALEKVKALQISLASHTLTYEKLTVHHTQAGALEEQIKSIQQHLAQLQEQELHISKQLELLDQQDKVINSDLAARQHALIKAQQHHNFYLQQRQHIANKIHTWRTRLAQSRLSSPHQLEQRLNEISGRLKHEQRICQEQLKLQQKQLQTQTQLTVLMQTLDSEHQKNITTLVAAQQAATMQIHLVQQQLKSIKTQQTTSKREEHEIVTARLGFSNELLQRPDPSLLKIQQQIFEKRKARYHEWTARANQLNTELNQVTHKRHLTAEDASSSCPLCEQNLSASRRRFLVEKFSNHQQQLMHRLARFRHILPHLKECLVKQHHELQELLQAQEAYALKQTTYEELGKQQVKVEVALEALNQEADKVELLLATAHNECQQAQKAVDEANKLHDYNQKHNKEIILLRKQLEETTQHLAQIAHNETEHQKMIVLYEELLQEKQCSNSITYTLDQQHEQRSEFLKLLGGLRTQRNEMPSAMLLQQECNHLVEQRTLVHRQQKTFLDQLDLLRSQKEHALEERGKLLNAQERMHQIALELAQEEQIRTQLSSELDDYQVISAALSKDGVQALLIEDAIPEIEQEANSLLAQLTDNQAHIFIDSLRDLKSGGTKETLDIKISDAAGIRPYELFSGGEAFRIDFALRIAISKLLARRAGTSLQTLIIDEGFGSQDEDGLAHMMDAIHRIQDNFCKVIIVSHLPTMKEQFPVHFVVNKEAQGSFIRIVQQG